MPAKILVVDDEPDLEALITQRFRRSIREGLLEFAFAQDGVAALGAVESMADLDLVISDINMPRMDGLTLLGHLQERDEPLSTVIVSAYGDMTNIRTAMNRGAFDFLTKPIDFTDFETTLQKTLRHVGRTREARQRFAASEQARTALSRYFSPNLAAELAGSEAAEVLKGGRRDLTVMFTDIAGFTGLVERLEPEILSELLNDYFGSATAIVFDHGGTVAKMMGDALHVLFGAPRAQEDHAGRAMACALALDRCCEELRERWNGRGVPIGRTRIGVHAGQALVGNFGHDRFFDYTAYGDTINVAARLEAANKHLGTRICVSEDVVRRAPDRLVRLAGDLLLRGRQDPLRCYEPLAEGSIIDVAGYAAAFARMERAEPEALGAFAALVAGSAQDSLSSFHLRRLLNGESGARVAVP